MSSNSEGSVYRFKVVLLGDARVGKTSIKNRIIGKKLSEKYHMTVGADFSLKELRGHSLLIWDLAGQESFDKIRSNYYKGSQGAILVYDITERSSFDNLAKWIEEMRAYSPAEVPIILAGNKVDLRESHENCIAPDEGIVKAKSLSEEFNSSVFFIETSALTGYNIEKAFDMLLDQMIEDVLTHQKKA